MRDDIDIDVDPPVLVDGELVVECEHSECNRRTAVGTDVDAVEADVDDGDWKVRFVPTDDGRLALDGAECHEHRTDKAIDRLEQTQRKTIEKIANRTRAAIGQAES